MPEGDLVARTDSPRTRQTLGRDLCSLGVMPGTILLVHSSLSALGWTVGGPVAVVQALMDALGEEGTLVMPTHSTDNSEPSHWQNPPVPAEWWPVIRESMPGYDPATFPTRSMGRIVDTFRSWPSVRRSDHPALSFAAWGSNAGAIVGVHPLDYPLGESSPLGRIYDLDGSVLLLGVGFGNNTSFHLGEYRSKIRAETHQGVAVLTGGDREWREYRDIELDDSRFVDLGADFEREMDVSRGRVGSAESVLFRQRPAVDFAQRWLTEDATGRSRK